MIKYVKEGNLPKRIGYFKRVKVQRRFGLFVPLRKGKDNGKAKGKA